MNRTRNEMRLIPLRLILFAGLSLFPFAAPAQGLDDEDSQPRRQFSVSEEGPRLRPSTETDLSKETEAPVRLARFRYVEGSVSWREDDKAAWSNATLHLPLRQGAQIWVEGKGRAEIQFDDGSLLRVGRDTLVTLQTLFSDMEGTFTEIKLHEGLLGLRLKHKLALYQIDAPFASLKATGPARIRAGARQESEFAVREGEATVENEMGSVKMRRGEYLMLANANSALETGRTPAEDSWDKWNRERDREQDNLESRPSQKYLPPNVSIVSDDLDRYGRWDQDREYGNVWYPSVSSANWRPYNAGYWAWVRPFGWTWVSYEPWGWAPYHYGSWICRERGWAWVPGRSAPCWSPAVVNFCHLNNRVVWVPLCPNEIVVSVRVSVRSMRLAQHFSIVTAGVYYPTSSTACGFRPWSSHYVNRRYHSDDRDTNQYAHNRQPTAA
jgi:hypothetical protein